MFSGGSWSDHDRSPILSWWILCDQCQINLKDNNFPTFVFSPTRCVDSPVALVMVWVSLLEFLSYVTVFFLFWTFSLNRQSNQRCSPDCTQINYFLFEWHHPLTGCFLFQMQSFNFHDCFCTNKVCVYAFLNYAFFFWTQCVTSDKCTIIKRSLLYYAWTGIFKTFFF